MIEVIIVTALEEKVHAVFSYFDEHMGPEVLTAVPPVSPEIQAQITKLMDIQTEEGFFLYSFEDLATANYIFFVPSPVARGGEVLVLASFLFDLNTRGAQRLRPILEECATALLAIEDLYKILHPKKYPAREVQSTRAALDRALADSQEQWLQVFEQASLGQLELIGLDRAGKTSLLNLLQNPSAPELAQRPTLGVNIVRLVLNEMAVTIYDVGGQRQFRNRWTTAVPSPAGIVYVHDIAETSADRQQESRAEFERFLDHARARGITGPLLVIGNKLDLTKDDPTTLLGHLQEVLPVPDLENPHEYVLTSAKTGAGVVEGFQWLVSQLMDRG